MSDQSTIESLELPEQKDPSMSELSDGWHYILDSNELEKSKAVEVPNFATQIVEIGRAHV